MIQPEHVALAIVGALITTVEPVTGCIILSVTALLAVRRSDTP